jgi:hypothetical protein
MADTATVETAKVIPLGSATAKRSSERKWGKKVMDLGFCIVPSLLLRAQRRLGLSPTQLAVLMHLADQWWDQERIPFPAKSTLAERLNLKTRQVQRHIAQLEKAGLVKRNRRFNQKGQTSNGYDLSGLVAKLKDFEPEFRRADDEAKQRRREMERPRPRSTRSTDKSPP